MPLALETYYQSQLDNMDADYYLFAYMKKTLPNGEQVYLYPQNQRRHGKRIMVLSTIGFIFWLWGVMHRAS
jgi:hypothetical protein